MKRKHSKKKLAALIVIIASFSSCSYITSLFNPSNGLFVSKNIASYNIKKIALLPMLHDTKDYNGTYYASNYFLDLLVTEYPKLEFAEIDDIREFDCSFLSQVTENIVASKKINKRNFLDTDLGLMLSRWNCDAIIIGVVDSTSYTKDKLSARLLDGSIYRILVSCHVSYYLVSLRDGRIIWKAKEIGSQYYEPFGESPYLFSLAEKSIPFSVPIAQAICNGIEKISQKLPEEIFNEF
jgi:hypothetical protein